MSLNSPHPKLRPFDIKRRVRYGLFHGDWLHLNDVGTQGRMGARFPRNLIGDVFHANLKSGEILRKSEVSFGCLRMMLLWRKARIGGVE